MKKFLLVFVILMSGYVYSQTPLIITKSNFPVDTYPDSVVFVSDITDFVNPTTGENVTWDYSNLENAETHYLNYVAPTSPDFPNAVFKAASWEPITTQLGYDFDNYYENNDNGFVISGGDIPEARYGIGQLTQNDDDSAIFPAQFFKYEPKINVMAYPTTYQTYNQLNYKRSAYILLTYSSFNIENARIDKISFFDDRDSCIGWGKISLPTKNGSSKPYEVLMFKRIIVKTDSFFLNGSANSAEAQLLLGAFGLTQGAKSGTYRYNFFSNVSKTYLLRVGYSDQNFTTPSEIIYNRWLEPATDVKEQYQSNSEVFTYPNPANSNTINLAGADKLIEPFTMKIMNQYGQLVSCHNLEPQPQDLKINLPNNLANGMYYYYINTNYTNQKYFGKIILQK